MDRTEAVTLTNMCMIVNQDRVLTIKREDPVWPGLAFPGGHVEKHESVHDSVVREVKEETNLDIDHPRLVGFKQFFLTNRTTATWSSFTGQTTFKERSSLQEKASWSGSKIADLAKRQLAHNFGQDLKLFLNPDLDEHMLFNKEDFLY